MYSVIYVTYQLSILIIFASEFILAMVFIYKIEESIAVRFKGTIIGSENCTCT